MFPSFDTDIPDAPNPFNPVAGDIGGYSLMGGVGMVAYEPSLGSPNDPSPADGNGQQPYSEYRDAPFDKDIFFSTFPEFKNKELYPSDLVEAAGKRARFYMTYSQVNLLDGEDRKYARSLLTAHLIVLITRARTQADGNTNGEGASGTIGSVGGSGIISSASVGGVSVSMSVPDSKDPWAYWLNQTTYGQELQGFLAMHVPAGIMGIGEFHRVLR